MAEQLLVAFKKDIAAFALIPSDRGKFEISLDGELIFSKIQQGRFPAFAEVTAEINGRNGNQRGDAYSSDCCG